MYLLSHYNIFLLYLSLVIRDVMHRMIEWRWKDKSVRDKLNIETDNFLSVLDNQNRTLKIHLPFINNLVYKSDGKII